MKMVREYPIVIAKEKRDVVAYIPDIPGGCGRGKTARQAKEDIRKALALYIEDCLADGDDVPKSSAKAVDVGTPPIAVGEEWAPPREVVEFLRSKGLIEKQQKGSLLILQNSRNGYRTVVPMHPGDLPLGLFLKILQDADFSLDDFRKE